MKQYKPFRPDAKMATTTGKGEWGPDGVFYVLASDAEADIKKAREEGIREGEQRHFNASEIRADERERIVRLMEDNREGILSVDKWAPGSNSFEYAIGLIRSRAPSEPKPLTKIDTSKFSEQYRWDNICEIAYAVNALVDAVKGLTRRFNSQEQRKVFSAFLGGKHDRDS